ncbi:hypothetical protein EVA_18611 [gut metagenome]|uniref:Uncharacterized protein n=1 Tax=gut metagenome TaxID=749906 RepID=J9FUM1_9ZZZZ
MGVTQMSSMILLMPKSIFSTSLVRFYTKTCSAWQRLGSRLIL